MGTGRVGKVKSELVMRYNRIANLYIAYTNSGAFADEFGREFFHAVGDVLNGTPVEKLTLYHIDPNTLNTFETIIQSGKSKGGTAAAKKKKTKTTKKKKKKAKPKPPRKKKANKKTAKPKPPRKKKAKPKPPRKKKASKKKARAVSRKSKRKAPSRRR